MIRCLQLELSAHATWGTDVWFGGRGVSLCQYKCLLISHLLIPGLAKSAVAFVCIVITTKEPAACVTLVVVTPVLSYCILPGVLRFASSFCGRACCRHGG